MFFSFLVQLLAVATTCVFAAPISRDAKPWTWRYVDYHSMESAPMDEQIPAGVTGTLYRRYKPLLSVVDRKGCYPSFAVDGGGRLKYAPLHTHKPMPRHVH